jgi:hypothetical protein
MSAAESGYNASTDALFNSLYAELHRLQNENWPGNGVRQV